MFKLLSVAAFVGVTALAPAYGQDHKDWCTDAHMKQMDAMVAKMTDADKKKLANEHLALSKDAMKKKNTAECVTHMEEAHKAMGM